MASSFDALTLLGAVLMAALLMSICARVVSVPKVSGYLVAGLLLGGSGLHLVQERDAHNLALFGRLAIALILFDIGGEFDPRMLRKHGRRCLTISAVETMATSLPSAGS